MAFEGGVGWGTCFKYSVTEQGNWERRKEKCGVQVSRINEHHNREQVEGSLKLAYYDI